MSNSTNSLINKVLKSRGVKNLDDLTVDERNDYDKWQSVLKGNDITVERIREFCDIQLHLIEEKYFTGALNDKQDSVLRAGMQFYLGLLKFIDSPKADRENLERYLTSLIN